MSVLQLVYLLHISARFTLSRLKTKIVKMVNWACLTRFPESNLWKQQRNREMETHKAMNSLIFISHRHQYLSSNWRWMTGAKIYAALATEEELAGYKKQNNSQGTGQHESH